MVKPHAAGALHQRFDNESRERLGVAFQRLLQRVRARVVRRQRDTHMFRQHAAKERMHALVRIAHRHGTGGVAMIAAAERDEAGARPLPAIAPELDRHLERDLDRDRARIGEEHPVEVARQHVHQAAREAQRRLVHQPAEHHVRHGFGLADHGGANMWMVVAVAGRPPRRHAVDQLAPVRDHDAAALGARDRERRRGRLHLCIRQPDMRPARRIPVCRRRARRWSVVIHGPIVPGSAILVTSNGGASAIDSVLARRVRCSRRPCRRVNVLD